MEEFRENVVKSFVNVQGLFERNENVARISAMINKKRRKDGISHTKFETPNGAKIHIESRARFNTGNITYEHIVRSLGKSTHVAKDKSIVLDIIISYGGYHDTYRKRSTILH